MTSPASVDWAKGSTAGCNTQSSKAQLHRSPQSGSRLGPLLSDVKVVVYQGVLSAASLLPRAVAFSLARGIGRAWYWRHHKRVAAVVGEMEQALGCKRSEARSYAQRYFEVASSESIEAYMRHCFRKDRLRWLIDFRGIANLEGALKKGKGAILCTGHIRGLFTFMLGLHTLGYKVNAVRRRAPQKGGRIAQWFNRRNTLINSNACDFLWMESGVNLRLGMQSAAALSRNEILIMLIDARQVAGSVPAKFFDYSVSLPAGHIVLSQATGAPLLNFFIHRPKNWAPQIAEIREPYDAPSGVEEGVQHSISILEQDIRRHPADWIWFATRDMGMQL